MGEAAPTLYNVASSPSNPLRNIRLILPDRPGHPEDKFYETYLANRENHNFFMFHPDYLESLKPFNPLRYMDIMGTNGSPLAEWADRDQPGLKLGFSGAPYEWIAQLSNELHKDSWWNIPHAASDDYIVQMARFLKNKINSPNRLYIEYSNELWNTAFNQWNYCVQLGASHFHRSKINSITYDSGNNLAVVDHTNHGFTTGTIVQVANVGDSAYNGEYAVTVINANSYYYTPASTPSGTAVPQDRFHTMMALNISESKEITSMNWDWESSKNSRINVTLATNHGWSTYDTILVCNADDPSLNGVFRMTSVSGNQLNFVFYGSAYNRLLPQTTVGNASPSTGTMRVFRLAVNSGSIPVGTLSNGNSAGRYHGKRAAEIHQIFANEFPGEVDRLAFVVGCWAAVGSSNETAIGQYKITLNNQLLGETVYSTAPYFNQAPISDNNLLGGVLKKITTITSSNSVATVTCAAHGFSTGDRIQIMNPTQPEYTGIFSVTVVDSNTFTYAVSGNPASPATELNPYLGGIFCVKNPPYIREISNISVSNNVVTCVCRGHGFANGEEVYISQIARPAAINTKYNVMVLDDDTFSFRFTTPSITVSGGVRPWCYRASLVTTILDNCQAHINTTTVNSLNDAKTRARNHNMTLLCYESGQHLAVAMANQHVNGLMNSYIQANRHPRMKDLYESYFSKFPLYNSGACQYAHIGSYSQYGSWGAKESQYENSPKWMALRALTIANSYTLTGPNSGGIGQSSQFTVKLPDDFTLDFELKITPSDNGGGGTFTPSSVTLNWLTHEASFTYTPASGGNYVITTTNNGGLTDPAPHPFPSIGYKIYNESGSGGVKLRGCGDDLLITGLVRTYGPNTILYKKYRALVGKIERVSIKEASVNRKYGTRVLYKDNYNAVYNEDDLVDHGTAVSLAQAYYEELLRLEEENDKC